MKRMLYLAIGLLAVAACTRQPVIPEDPVTDPEEEQLVDVTLIAGIPETRTEVWADSNTGQFLPYWSAGEETIGLVRVPSDLDLGDLSLYDSGFYEYPSFSLTGTENERLLSRTFIGQTYAGDHLAYYPVWHDEERDDDDNLVQDSYGCDIWLDSDKTGYFSWTVPFVQHPPKDSFDPTADCMITESPFTVYESINETVIVSFTRLNAIVRVVLQDKQTQGDDMAFPLAGQHVRSVVLGNDTDYEEEKEGTLLSGDIEYLFMGDGEPFLEYRGKDRVVAEYTDKTTYVIGEEGAATFFITIPCVLKQSENPLYIRVETDDYIIERSITLPADVGLQPSRMTTLNVGLFDDGVKGTKYTRKGITLLEPVWDQEAWDYHYVPMTSMTVEVGEDSEFAFKVAGIIPEVESLGEFVFGPSDSDLIRPVLEYGRYDSEKGLFRGVSVHGIRLGEELFTIELTAGSTVYTASIPVTVTLGEKGRSLEGNYGEDNEPGQGINGNKYVEEGEL